VAEQQILHNKICKHEKPTGMEMTYYDQRSGSHAFAEHVAQKQNNHSDINRNNLRITSLVPVCGTLFHPVSVLRRSLQHLE
jgi:hypothetical protein